MSLVDIKFGDTVKESFSQHRAVVSCCYSIAVSKINYC